MGKNYNSDLESIYIQQVDANNLYGWGMALELLTHGFKWRDNVEGFSAEGIAKLVKKDKKGYFLEVDIEYPRILHKRTMSCLFLQERIK